MGRKLIDLTGQTFGRLTVIEHLGREHHSSIWLCRCECGTEVRAAAVAMKSGSTKSCGCHRRDRMAGLTFKHGERGGANREKTPPEYKTWDGIKQRCLNPKANGFERYGGRGIRMAAEWRDDFAAFFAHVGPRPSSRHSIDRIDRNGDYAPGNVRWATTIVQARNRSNNLLVEWGGRVIPLSEAAEAAGVPYKTVRSRVARGWPVLKALTTPPDKAKVNAARRSSRTP